MNTKSAKQHSRTDFIVSILRASTSTKLAKFRKTRNAMKHSRSLLALISLATLGIAGCGGRNDEAIAAPQNPAASVPFTAYAARTDLMAIKIPDGAPVRWHSAKYPPLKSVRLLPNAPDADLALELRKQFGKAILDPADTSLLTPTQSAQIARLTVSHFGTPATPTVRVPAFDQYATTGIVRFDQEKSFGANLKAAKTAMGRWKWADQRADWETATAIKANLKLDDATLARGSILYRRWCMQCHGPSGAGDAAYAIELGAMPRDYRQGVFKFTRAFPPATQPKKNGLGASGKPLRDDLKRTVRLGLDGSFMPAFSSLTESELDDVVSYVIHLSIRGETEFATIAKAMQPTESDPDFVDGELDWLFAQMQIAVLYNWSVARKNAIPIPAQPKMTQAERIQAAIRGYKLYNSAEFGCASCHANYGRAQQLKWDAWGTIVQPRNLTLGVYRGGRTGEDLYARLYGGIAPSGMTAFHDRVANAPPGQPNKLWDIVHFLHALGDAHDRKRMQELDREIKFDQ